jgi:hypothetical protein
MKVKSYSSPPIRVQTKSNNGSDVYESRNAHAKFDDGKKRIVPKAQKRMDMQYRRYRARLLLFLIMFDRNNSYAELV